MTHADHKGAAMDKFLSLVRPRKVTTLPSSASAGDGYTSQYAIARSKKQTAIATYVRDELYMVAGRLYFAPNTNYSKGVMPDIAMNSAGVLVEVHKAQYWDKLYCTVGSISDEGKITLGSSKQYGGDGGVRPSIALNDNNVAVEIHQASDAIFNMTLWYSVGKIQNGDISFGGSLKLDAGMSPQVAINGNGLVVSVHLTSNLATNALYYHVGTVDTAKGIINFGSSRDYDYGHCPHVAITDDNYVIEVHQSQSAKTLWYRLGRVDEVSKSITWLTPEAVKFADGTDPSVSVWNGRVSIVYQNNGAAYMMDGLLVSPNWMTDEFGRNATLKLNQIALPGSHDADMFEATRCTAGGGTCNTVTQTKTLYDQLVHGARYFDLRPVIWKDELELGHFSAPGPKEDIRMQGCCGQYLRDALQDIARFAEQSTDLIILKFSHYLNVRMGEVGFTPEEMDRLFTYVDATLGTYMYKDSSSTTLGSMPIKSLLGDTKAKILCVFSNVSPSAKNRAKGIFSYKDFDASGGGDLIVYDKYSETNDLGVMISRQEERIVNPANRNADSLYLLSWTLTQSPSQAILCPAAFSILDLAKIANDALYSNLCGWLATHVIGRSTISNVIYVDAYDAEALTACYLVNDVLLL